MDAAQDNEKLITQLAEALGCANELLDAIRLILNPSSYAWGLLGFDASRWLEAVRSFPIQWANAEQVLDPLIPHFWDVTKGAATFGNFAEPTAIEVLLKLGEFAEHKLTSAAFFRGRDLQTLTSDEAKDVSDECRESACLPPVEWKRLGVLIDREIGMAIAALCSHQNNKKAASNGPPEGFVLLSTVLDKVNGNYGRAKRIIASAHIPTWKPSSDARRLYVDAAAWLNHFARATQPEDKAIEQFLAGTEKRKAEMARNPRRKTKSMPLK